MNPSQPTEAQLEALQRALHAEHDEQQAHQAAAQEAHIQEKITLAKIEHLPFKGLEQDIIIIDETVAAHLEAQGAGTRLKDVPVSPAVQRVQLMDDVFAAMPQKDQVAVNEVTERLRFLLAKHGENARFAIIRESIKIAASEGQ